MSVTSEIARARSLIRVVPDHPSPGVAFQDITPLLADARALVDDLADHLDHAHNHLGHLGRHLPED